MHQPLHPNLARLAAAYDEIFERWSRGLIDAARARAEISALVARDDEGILWSISPDSGQWRRRTRSGDFVEDTPPSFGLATPTAHDLTRDPAVFNPDSRLTFHRVDDDLLAARPDALAGVTRRQVAVPAPRRPARRRAAVCVGLAVAAVVAWAALAQPQQATAPTSTTLPPASVPAPPPPPG